MTGVIAVKEIRNNLLEFRFQVTIALFLLLIISSTVMMSMNYKRQMADFNSMSKKHVAALDNMTQDVEFSIFGMTQEVKPKSLSIFAIGTEPDRTRALQFSQLSEVIGTLVGQNKYANPVFSLFPPPDFVYVVNIVLSLLALLFAFDAISGEKEDQTLKLMMTNPVSKATVLMGKFLGGLACLAAPYTLAFLIAAGVAVGVGGGEVFSGDNAVRFTLLYAVSLLYIAVFFSIGLFISTLSGQSGTTLMIALFVWVITVLAIPNVAPIVAGKMVGVPSSGKMMLARMSIEQELQDEYAKNINKERAERPQSGQNDDPTADGPGLGNDDMQKKVAERFEYFTRNKKNKIKQQIDLTRYLSIFSPSASYMFLATSIAGTGVFDFLKLREEAEIFHKQFLEASKEARIDTKKPETVPERFKNRNPMPPYDGDKLPQFKPAALPLATSIMKALLELGVLAGFLVLSFIAAFIRFMRYDVK